MPENITTETVKFGVVKVHIDGEPAGSLISGGITTSARVAYSIRDGRLPGDYPDNDGALAALVAAHRPAPHREGPVHAETHLGREIIISFVPGNLNDASTAPDRYTLTVNGRPVSCPTGDIATIARKIRVTIDREDADAELLPRLRALIDARTGSTGLEHFPAEPPMSGRAYVWAMGRYRRGLVTKLTKTRATVSYTTATSNGRVYHKTASHDDLLAA